MWHEGMGVTDMARRNEEINKEHLYTNRIKLPVLIYVYLFIALFHKDCSSLIHLLDFGITLYHLHCK